MTTPLISSNINSLADFIEQSFHEYADKPAFHCNGQTLTFAEIEEKSRAKAIVILHDLLPKQIALFQILI